METKLLVLMILKTSHNCKLKNIHNVTTEGGGGQVLGWGMSSNPGGGGGVGLPRLDEMWFKSRCGGGWTMGVLRGGGDGHGGGTAVGQVYFD